MVEKIAARRQRRAADTARWCERLQRGAAVYPVEVDGLTFDLMERFAGLKASKVDDRQAVVVALGRLFAAQGESRLIERGSYPARLTSLSLLGQQSFGYGPVAKCLRGNTGAGVVRYLFESCAAQQN